MANRQIRRDARTGRYTVVMKSRGGQRVQVKDPLDARFLEIADSFELKAAKITGRPATTVEERSDR